MIPGLEALACQELAVPMDVMEHVVRVESSFNPWAIGVVGARLARQPASLEEAVATASQLERDGYNFSLGLAQVNRHNLAAQGLESYEQAFAACPNLAAGARILADCHRRAGGDWGKAFSCYYSGNFVRGFKDGYVQKVWQSMAGASPDRIATVVSAIPVAIEGVASARPVAGTGLRERRVAAAPRSPEARFQPASDRASRPAAGAVAQGSRDAWEPPTAGAFVPEVGAMNPRPLPPPSAGPAGAAVEGRDSAFVF